MPLFMVCCLQDERESLVVEQDKQLKRAQLHRGINERLAFS